MKVDLFENPIEVRTAVPPPQFDDRRVVQRAQRVVPLDEIRTKLRLRKLVFFGGAFAIAIMLGAASALVAVQLKRVAASRVASQTSQIQVTNNEEAVASEADTTAAAQLDLTADSALGGETPAVEEPATRAVT